MNQAIPQTTSDPRPEWLRGVHDGGGTQIERTEKTRSARTTTAWRKAPAVPAKSGPVTPT